MSDEVHRKERFTDEREIERLVESFESCALAPAEFDHGAHLAVAFWYLSHATDAEAARRRMCDGLHRYTAHNNAQAKYNETITLFWLKIVRAFLARADARLTTPAEQANELVAVYAGSRLVFDYYSRALIETPEAKTSWVEPDLKPLDF